MAGFRFEIFGRVQRVSFREYTKRKARTLKLVGWVKNTPENTVVGVAFGPPESLGKLKKWLQEKGSPSSVIERAEFTEEVSGSDVQTAMLALNLSASSGFEIDTSFGHAVDPRKKTKTTESKRFRF